MSGGDEQVPDRVVAGRYRLERVLGRGGMGVVWLAVDTLIERRVALKELRAPAGVSGSDESSFVERALREARNAGRLNHPGVVAVHDVIAPTGSDDAVYIVMEYVEAPTLGELIDQQGALPAARVAAMGQGILDALMAAHTMGIVHRDVKPSNVLVRDGDRVKLSDFGIALAAEDTRLTRSGVMGTHAYLAPESFDTGEVGPAADLWALGATLFHAVAGRAPFERDTTTATLRAILFEDPPAPPCGPPLADVITGLLTRPVGQRLTGDAARQKLEEAAAQPTAPATEAPDGQGGWEAQATTVHRAPPPPATRPPTGPSWGHTTQPGGPPTPYGPTQPTPAAPPLTGPGGPGGPGSAGFPHPGSGSGPAPPAGPMTGPTSGPSWAGSPPPRNNTPWIIGGVAAAAAVLLLIVIVASSGGGGSESGGGGSEGGGGEIGGSSESGSGTEEEAIAQDFVAAINSGDANSAIGALCASSPAEDEITAAVAADASIEIDPATVQADPDISYGGVLSGTVGGATVGADSYLSVVNDGEDVGWCVYRFDLGQDFPPE